MGSFSFVQPSRARFRFAARICRMERKERLHERGVLLHKSINGNSTYRELNVHVN